MESKPEANSLCFAMKKLIPGALSLFLCLALTACAAQTPAETPAPTAEPTPEPVTNSNLVVITPPPETPLPELLLTADFAAEDMLSTPGQYYQAVSGYSKTYPDTALDLVISAKSPVTNLYIADGSLEGTPDGWFRFVNDSEPFFALDSFTSEKSILLNMVFIGDSPTTAIFFTDESGTEHCYGISASGKGEGVILMELDV